MIFEYGMVHTQCSKRGTGRRGKSDALLSETRKVDWETSELDRVCLGLCAYLALSSPPFKTRSSDICNI